VREEEVREEEVREEEVLPENFASIYSLMERRHSFDHRKEPIHHRPSLYSNLYRKQRLVYVVRLSVKKPIKMG